MKDYTRADKERMRRAFDPVYAEAVRKRERETWARIALVFLLLGLLSLVAVGVQGCGEVTLATPVETLTAPDAGASRETAMEVAADALTKSAAPDATLDAGGAGGSESGGGRVDSARVPEVVPRAGPCAPYPAPAVTLTSYGCPGSAVVTCDLEDHTGVIVAYAVGCTTAAGALCAMACP